MNFDNWLKDVAEKAPELGPFIQKLERYFENERFKSAEFEKAVELGTKSAGDVAFETEEASSDD